MRGLTHEEAAKIREQAKSYKAEGHTMQEVADKFGISKGYAQRICKGIAPQRPDLKGIARNQWTSISIKIREAKAIETINNHLTGFEYVGGFTHCDGSVDLKCKKCGCIVTRSLIGIRHGNGVKCPDCADIEREQRIKQKQQEKEHKRLEKKRLQLLSVECKQIEFGVCKECGSIFVKTGRKKFYCSDICRKRWNNRKKDNRINHHNLVDKDITLVKLYERDNGICYLCGSVCDWNDKVMDGNGNTIVGKNYPTIEHMTPLALGGKHAWSNVKLACHKCNTAKNMTPLPKFYNRYKQ